MPHHRRLRRSWRQLLSSSIWRTRLSFWLGAIVVGLVASGLAIAAEHANHVFMQWQQQYPYLPFILTPLGLVLITWITRELIPGAEGSGIPQAIAALKLGDQQARQKLLSLKIAVGKVLLVPLGLLCGASIGREGPTVHIAAAIMYSLRQWARFPHYDVGRGLILAGSAAGIAAAFNTPLAGIVFVIEEMSRDFESKTSGTVLTAVILAGLTALAIQGDYSYLGAFDTDVDLYVLAFAVLVCGLVGGASGGLFSAVLVKVTLLLQPWRNRYAYWIALSCGLVVAGIGWSVDGQSYGSGYQQIQILMLGEQTLHDWFVPAKFMATLSSYWSGIPGGIFAPSLSIGAGLGQNISVWLPDAPAMAIIMLGMVAYFTGVVQAPITAVVIVMEMSTDPGFILPLMATALIANIISRFICLTPIYRILAMQFINVEQSKPNNASQQLNDKNKTMSR